MEYILTIKGEYKANYICKIVNVAATSKRYFNMDNKLLRKIDVCEMLGVSIGKVDLMMDDGLKYIKLNRNVRFRVEDVNEYLNNKIVVWVIKRV